MEWYPKDWAIPRPSPGQQKGTSWGDGGFFILPLFSLRHIKLKKPASATQWRVCPLFWDWANYPHQLPSDKGRKTVSANQAATCLCFIYRFSRRTSDKPQRLTMGSAHLSFHCVQKKKKKAPQVSLFDRRKLVPFRVRPSTRLPGNVSNAQAE